MDKLMDSPWFLRFFALFLAMVLFFSVQAEEKDKKNKTAGDQHDIIREVPVEVYYDNENLVVTGVPEMVNITIEGPINIVQTTKLLKDFTVFVDLRSLPMGEHQVRIQHENLSEKLQVHLDPASIDILIEEKLTETFRVDPEMNERLLAEGFNVVDMEVNPSTIEVTGAKSIIESISFVKATVASDEGITKSFEQQARIRVLDRDLNKLNVSIVPEQVNIKVKVAENSKEVPIVLNEVGESPAHVLVDSVASEDKVVTLYGPSKVLEEIEDLKIDVDLSKIKGPGSIEVELKKPKGVTSLSRAKIKVDVKATATEAEGELESDSETVVDEEVAVSAEPVEEPEPSLGTKKFENVQVAVEGLDEQFKSTPVNGLVTLTVTAEPDVLDTLEASDFAVSIDASGASSEGEQTFPVKVEGPSDVRWTLSDNEVTLKIELA